MNLRQKAKYYKRKYEELANMPLPKCSITQHKVDMFKASTLYPAEVVGTLDNQSLVEDVCRNLTKQLANKLMKNLNEYVQIKTDYIDCLNQYKINAMMGVVKINPIIDEVSDERSTKESAKEI